MSSLIQDKPIIHISAYGENNLSYEFINSFEEFPRNELYSCQFEPLWSLGKQISPEELNNSQYEEIDLWIENKGKNTNNFLLDAFCTTNGTYDNNYYLGQCVEKDKHILFETGNYQNNIINVPNLDSLISYQVKIFFMRTPENRHCVINYNSEEIVKTQIISYPIYSMGA